MLIGLAFNWGVFIPSAILVMFVWQGDLLGAWLAALGAVSLFGMSLVWRALRHAW